MKTKYLSLLVLAGVLAVSVANTASADTGLRAQSHRDENRGYAIGKQMHQNNAVSGIVTAVSGNTLTVSSQTHPRGKESNSTASTVYTVDATNATVNKNNATSSVSSIAVGDRVVVFGTISGTSVKAVTIKDGMAKSERDNGSMPIMANGQPIIAGKITNISGSVLTITNRGSVTYTVDASNAKIFMNRATTTIASLVVNDNVLIQGTVNGNSVIASSVISKANNQTQIASGTPAMMNKGGC